MKAYTIELVNLTRGEVSTYEIAAWSEQDAIRHAVAMHDGYSGWDVAADDIAAQAV